MNSKYTFGFLIVLFCSTSLLAQELKDATPPKRDDTDGVIVIDASESPQPTIAEDNMIYNAPEIQPGFPGGLKKFYNFITENFKYPESDEIKGNVYVMFIVEKDGSLTDIKVARDLGYGTGAEAKRVLSLSPKWKPAIQNGRVVRSLYSIPIKLDSTTQIPENTMVYTTPEVMPGYPGGMKAFYFSLQNKFNPPKKFHGNGQVIATFIVEKDGTLTDIKTTQDIGGDSATQIIDLLQKGPKWQPGIQDGKQVRTQYVFPIKITVQ